MDKASFRSPHTLASHPQGARSWALLRTDATVRMIRPTLAPSCSTGSCDSCRATLICSAVAATALAASELQTVLSGGIVPASACMCFPFCGRPWRRLSDLYGHPGDDFSPAPSRQLPEGCLDRRV